MEQSIAELITSDDPTEILNKLNSLEGEIHSATDNSFDAFLDLQTIERITSMLEGYGHRFSFHDTVLALGLLLNPLMNSGASTAARGLLLPLPDDPLYANLVAAYWLSLTYPFLCKADFEISIFIGTFLGKLRLAIGFNGANPADLASLMSSPDVLKEQFFSLDDSEWVNAHLHESEKAKLSSYLQQPKLSLRTVQDTFHKIFTGA